MPGFLVDSTHTEARKAHEYLHLCRVKFLLQKKYFLNYQLTLHHWTLHKFKQCKYGTCICRMPLSYATPDTLVCKKIFRLQLEKNPNTHKMIHSFKTILKNDCKTVEMTKYDRPLTRINIQHQKVYRPIQQSTHWPVQLFFFN